MSDSKEDYKDMKGEEDPGKSTKILVTHFADDSKDPPQEEINYFAESCNMRNTLTNSFVDPNAPLKNRVTLLEVAVENQKERDDVTFENIKALSKDSDRIDAALSELIKVKTAKIEEDMKRFKQEVHHRFELQGAENKRLQASVAALKAENHSLTKELFHANENLSICIREMGIDDDELSRPNTAM